MWSSGKHQLFEIMGINQGRTILHYLIIYKVENS